MFTINRSQRSTQIKWADSVIGIPHRQFFASFGFPSGCLKSAIVPSLRQAIGLFPYRISFRPVTLGDYAVGRLVFTTNQALRPPALPRIMAPESAEPTNAVHKLPREVFIECPRALRLPKSLCLPGSQKISRSIPFWPAASLSASSFPVMLPCPFTHGTRGLSLSVTSLRIRRVGYVSLPPSFWLPSLGCTS